MALRVAAFAGGVGGAKLADGLSRSLPDDHLTMIVNTGDDFEHLGLMISPDLDTVTYTLAGIANPETGWGRADESWNFLQVLETLGGPTWFRLGDRDLALHVERTRRLQEGQALSAITADMARRLGVKQRVLPMTDDRVRTFVDTDRGELPFQEYFVMHRCEPRVRKFRFAGSRVARPAPGVLEAIESADIIVFCPSNPWVSLDPILSLTDIACAVIEKPIVGVSPIVGGKALRGPAAKMFMELGIEPSARNVADHFKAYLNAFVIDSDDRSSADAIENLGMEVLVTNAVMRTVEDRERLARDVLGLAKGLLEGQRSS
ncbi:MAG: 2-phospho-L-lactate transferase [Anaerolineales bacterium]|jgi:LPPG:FO 2-phospho-L-lactate transferase